MIVLTSSLTGNDYEMIEMDTDSSYMALTGDYEGIDFFGEGIEKYESYSRK